MSFITNRLSYGANFLGRSHTGGCPRRWLPFLLEIWGLWRGPLDHVLASVHILCGLSPQQHQWFHSACRLWKCHHLGTNCTSEWTSCRHESCCWKYRLVFRWCKRSWLYGHVAWVAEVNGDQVTIEEYNYNAGQGPEKYHKRSSTRVKYLAISILKTLNQEIRLVIQPTLLSSWWYRPLHRDLPCHINRRK